MPVDRVRGRDRLLPRVLELLDDVIPKGAKRLRMGVVHADNPGEAERIRAALQQRYQPYEIVVGPVTAVIGIHTGPDAWGVFYQVEDGARGNGGTGERNKRMAKQV
jgi:fatty acid-binding protein DegV